MPSVEHFYAIFRNGLRRYHSRPPANCRSAREAWDSHAEKGPVIWLQLLDGYWGAMRQNGNVDEIENTFLANRGLKREDQ
jgi:hypothetical protein